MSLLRNLLGNFMPHFESRRNTAVLNALNAELVVDIDGDNAALIHIMTSAALAATYVVEGSPDGVNYYAIPVFAFGPGSVNGTIPQPCQPIISEASTLAIQRILCANVGGLRKIRVRFSAWTSGSATVTINTDDCESISPYLRNQKAASLHVTNTAAVSTAVTATLPAVAGLRHYIDRISVVRSATAALTPSATPVLVTTTNLPGLPVITFGSDAGGIGIDKEQVLDFGGAGLAASAVNTATTVVCPVYTGVIWRVNVSYRLGF